MKEITTIEEAKRILENLTKGQISVKLEKHGESYVLPLAVALMLLKKDLTLNVLKSGPPVKQPYATAVAGATAGITPASGKMWDVLLIQAEYHADANVADRTCSLYVPETGLGGIAGASPTTQFDTVPTVSMQATHYATIIWLKGESVIWANDNGTITRTADDFPSSLHLYTGGDIQAKISANPQVADAVGIYALVVEHEHEGLDDQS